MSPARDHLPVQRHYSPPGLDRKDEGPSYLFLCRRRVNHEREIIAALEESHGRISGPSGAAEKHGMPRTILKAKTKSLRINGASSSRITDNPNMIPSHSQFPVRPRCGDKNARWLRFFTLQHPGSLNVF